MIILTFREFIPIYEPVSLSTNQTESQLPCYKALINCHYKKCSFQKDGVYPKAQDTTLKGEKYLCVSSHKAPKFNLLSAHGCKKWMVAINMKPKNSLSSESFITKSIKVTRSLGHMEFVQVLQKWDDIIPNESLYLQEKETEQNTVHELGMILILVLTIQIILQCSSKLRIE